MKKMNDVERTIKKLKELIDKNGYDYLTDKPLAVYKELEEAAPDEIITAGAILMLLAYLELVLQNHLLVFLPFLQDALPYY